MRARLASLPTLLLTVGLGACTATGPSLLVRDADGALDEPRDPILGWSTTGGSASLAAPGTHTLPERFSVRLESEDDEQHWLALTTGAVEVVAGSTCRITRPAACADGVCAAELEVASFGICLIRVRATTIAGDPLATCWYRAIDEGVGAEAQAGFERLSDSAYAMSAACIDGL